MGCLVLQAAGARAESWSVIEGRISIHGKSQPLSGAFEGSEFEPEPPDGDTPVVLSLDDFAFTAGRRELTPRIPVEYDGLFPVAWLQIGDAILIEGEQVTFLRVRSGGKLVAESDDEVAFRFLELRADAEDGGYVLGRLGDTDLPRRLVLKGDVYAVRQSFGLPGPECEQTPGGGGTPGGGVVIGSGGAIVSFESFDVHAQETVLFERPAGAGAVLNRVDASGATQIEGELRSDGSVYLLNPAGVVFESTSADAPTSTPEPTLEELGIHAPEGAEVEVDAAGAVRVTSAGDLVVDGARLGDASTGLANLTVSTSGNIVVTGRLQTPASLRLQAGGEIQIGGPGGEIVPAEDSTLAAPTPAIVGLPDFCAGLRPILPADERRIGRFSLVASAARQVKIDVQPDQKRNRIHPGTDETVRVVLFGSRSLDVRDIDLESLRLGRGEAQPLSIFPPPGGRFGRRQFLWSQDGDRYPDWLATFAVRDAEVAFGDPELCLVAKTEAGETLEGCNRIDARPALAPLR